MPLPGTEVNGGSLVESTTYMPIWINEFINMDEMNDSMPLQMISYDIGSATMQMSMLRHSYIKEKLGEYLGVVKRASLFFNKEESHMSARCQKIHLCKKNRLHIYLSITY